jgi:F0F1-type ATP synthase epsilon subunit
VARAKDLDEAAAVAAKQKAEEALRDRVEAIEKLRRLRKGG